MVRFLKLVVVVPIAIALLAFAFANRHIVTVSFDPFPSGDVPAFAISAPLFVILILTAMLGVVAGGVNVIRAASVKTPATDRNSRLSSVDAPDKDGRRPAPAAGETAQGGADDDED